nr:hypothetical protein [Roseovarius pacificus]
MSQHSMNIGNVGAAAARAALNEALPALASLSSGAAEPATKFGNMLWYDTANKILKMRTAANDGWISLFYLDQTAGKFRMLENVQIVDASGTQKGLLGPQTEATWKAGVGALESLITPAKLKAAIEELAPKGGMTALGTQATTSGKTVTMSGLTLTGYKSLQIVFDNIRVGTIATTGDSDIEINGVPIDTLANRATFDGMVTIDLVSGVHAGSIRNTDITGTPSTTAAVAGASSISTASTEVSLTSSGNAFSNGQFIVNGMK